MIAKQACDAVIRPDVSTALGAAVGMLRSAGAHVEDVVLHALKGFAERLVEILLPEAARLHAERLGANEDAFGPQARAQLEPGPGVSAMADLAARDYARALGRA